MKWIDENKDTIIIILTIPRESVPFFVKKNYEISKHELYAN